MRHIVIIAGSYYPNYSATAKCGGNIAEILAKDNKVTVITCKTELNESDYIRYKNQDIFRISTKEGVFRKKLDNKIKNQKGVTRKVYKMALMILRVWGYLKVVSNKNSLKESLVSAYENALNEIKSPIDLIIPLAFPFESIIASMAYRENHANTKVIPLIFDPLVESDTLHRNKLNKIFKRKIHLNIEKKIILSSEKVVVVHTQKKHFEKEFPTLLNKFVFIEHPLLIQVKQSNVIISEDNSVAKLLYAGNLILKYVEPTYLLKLLINVEENYTIDFYTKGSGMKIIDKYIRAVPTRIRNKGFVARDVLETKIVQSHILISIAEVNGKQMSSKIFDYMSLGKPIIHFYSVTNDINVQILKNYPLALCLKQDYKLMNTNTKRFIEFINENKEKQIDFKEVEKIFYYATPEYIAKTFKYWEKEKGDENKRITTEGD